MATDWRKPAPRYTFLPMHLWNLWHRYADEMRHSLGLRQRCPALLKHPPPAGQFFFLSDELPALVELVRTRLPGLAARLIAEAEKICRHRFDLAGYESLDFGTEIDWHLNPLTGQRARLTPWYQAGEAPPAVRELNRHQHLETLAKAFLLNRDRRFLAELRAQWQAWQVRNPYPLGVNWASGLEIAIRSMAWIWMDALLAVEVPGEFRRDVASALSMHALWLEHFLDRTSNLARLAGAGALFSIGLLYPQFRAAHRWLTRGWKIICLEAQRQAFPDGMHCERSARTHACALAFLLQTRILATRNGLAVPAELDTVIIRMGEALRVLSQAGSYSEDRLPDSLGVIASLFERADFKAASADPPEHVVWLLGGLAQWDALPACSPPPASGRLPASGIHCLVSPGPPVSEVVVDHVLCVRWVAAARLRITGPVGFVLPPATSASVTKWVTAQGFDLLVGGREGQQRWVICWKDGPVIVRDVVRGPRLGALAPYWRPAPGFAPTAELPGLWRFSSNSGTTFSLCWVEALWACKQECGGLRFRAGASQPTEFALALPRHGGTASLTPLLCPAGLAAYDYSGPDGSMFLLFCDGTTDWCWRDWSSDAALLAFGTLDGQLFLSAAGASRLSFRGHSLLSEAAALDAWELRGSPAIDSALLAHNNPIRPPS